MRTGKKLAFIAAGYALAIAGGLGAVALNEWRMPEGILQTSGGMVAFGDMILFVLATGVLSLVPSWFLLRLAVQRAPRLVLAILLGASASGPVSWLLVSQLAAGQPSSESSLATNQLLGVLIAFCAIPRIVFGPVLLVIEGAMLILARKRLSRALLVIAMLMDLVPLTMFARHMARAVH